MFTVYVIVNEIAKIYIGQTRNLVNRLKRHNRILPSKKTSYTSKNKGNWELLYKEEFKTRHEALLREKYFKTHVGRDWLRSVIGPVAQR